MAYTTLSQGFDVSSDAYIDKRIVLTKEQMLTAEDDFFLPDLYFAFCPDDGSWYTFNIDNEEDPETGKYRLMPSGLVNDVLVNGVSVVEDKIAKVRAVEDVKVDGSSVVSSEGVAEIALDEYQKKLTAGDKIKIENNIISVEGLKDPQPGFGINVDSEGNISIDNSVVPTTAMIPTQLSELYNDMGFIDKSVADLENYYLKGDTYTKDEVNELLESMAGGVELEVVAVLPLEGESNKIYLVRRTIDSNIYDQYVWFSSGWVQVGSTEVDLSQYYTKSEVDQLLQGKQGNLTAGAGIVISGNFIAADLGTTMTTTGNRIDVKEATPSQKGIVSYDDSTIKMNASGQLYSVGGGSGGSYVAGQNIQINGNVISATDTTYRAGDGIKMNGDLISANVDDQTIHTNRYGELYMDAVPIESGNGIVIHDGRISIEPNEVADSLDLEDYQKKLIAGNNIQIDPVTNVISATGGGSGSGANWGEIGGTLSNQADLQGALNGKQKQLVAGSNITLTDLGAQVRISAEGGGGGGASSFADLSGSPYDNTLLGNALDGKQPLIDSSHKIPADNVSGLAAVAKTGDYDDLIDKPVVGNATVSIYQGSSLKGTFKLNDTIDKVITLDEGGSGPSDTKVYIFSSDQWGTEAFNINTWRQIKTENGFILLNDGDLWYVQSNSNDEYRIAFSRVSYKAKDGKAYTGVELIHLVYQNSLHKIERSEQMNPLFSYNSSTGLLDILVY